MSRPIEGWVKDDWESVENSLKDHLDYFRKDYDLKSILGEDLSPAQFKSEKKDYQKFWENRRGSAHKALNQVRKQIESSPSNVRGGYFSQIREWRKVFKNPNIPAEKKRLLLAIRMDDETVAVPSDSLSIQLATSLQDGRNFKALSRDGFPVTEGVINGNRKWQYELIPEEIGKARDEMSIFEPAPDFLPKAQRAMIDYAEQLSDRDSDLITLLMSYFSEKAKHPDDQIWVELDDVMEALGYSKHKGGYGESYKSDDKARVRKGIANLQNNYLTIGQAIKRERTFDSIQSRVFIIFDRTGQPDLSGHIAEWKNIKIGFGRAWSTNLFDPLGKLSMNLQKQALQYNPRIEVYEKRMAKYLSFYWRVNWERKDSRISTTHEIWTKYISESPEDIDRRKAVRMDEALDRLKIDGIIGDWKYLDGIRTSDMTRFAKGWEYEWFKKEIEIEAPRDIIKIYQDTRKARVESKKAPLITKSSIGEEFRRFREARNITGLQASQLLGIRNDALSRYERGTRVPNSVIERAMTDFMREVENRPILLRELANK